MNLPKIPIFSTPDKPLSGATQDVLPLVDIVDDVAIFEDGGAALIMESSSLNFGLLSDREQQAVIAAYAALINSFTFPMQILVRSQRKDISSYLRYLDEAYANISNEKLRGLMTGYRRYIGETIKKKNVLSKRFYIIIPFSAYELGAAKSIKAATRTKGPLPYPKSYVVKKAKITLLPKRDHLLRQAGRLGLKLRQLKRPELISLFYDVYNPIRPPVKTKEGEHSANGQQTTTATAN